MPRGTIARLIRSKAMGRPDFAKAREAMVTRQIEARGARDPHLLAAMRQVPREAFVAADLAEFAYDDMPLPIEAGQTISQPFIVALMIEAARIGPGDRVLEVGAGSGYAAAVMARIGARVVAVERHEELAALARRRLGGEAEVHAGDGTRGWPAGAPYDAILVAAAGPEVPEPLKAQLAPGGRLVMPVGEEEQMLVRLTRTDAGFEREELGDVRFVPLIGEHGWPMA
jgi:protein-L-isoaspartate(D-aspartate) O-methyltransferase